MQSRWHTSTNWRCNLEVVRNSILSESILGPKAATNLAKPSPLKPHQQFNVERSPFKGKREEKFLKLNLISMAKATFVPKTEKQARWKSGGEVWLEVRARVRGYGNAIIKQKNKKQKEDKLQNRSKKKMGVK